MFNESKSRRLYIMQQIAMRQKQKQQNKSSIQKRKLIQTSFNQFRKTMSNFSHSNGFQNSFSNNQTNQQSQIIQKIRKSNNPFERSKLLKEQYDQALKIPSFKDLKSNTISQSKAISVQENDKDNILTQLQNNQHEREKQIQHEQNNNVRPEKVIEKSDQQEYHISPVNNQIDLAEIKQDGLKTPISINRLEQVKNTQIKSVQNQSGTSALFFTSQFQQYLNQKDHKNIIQIQYPPPQTQNQVQIIQENSQNIMDAKRQSITQTQTFGKVNLLESQIKSPFKILATQRSNTDQIKDKVKQQQKQQEKIQVNVQTEKQTDHVLIRNKSGHMSNASLAISNSQNNSSLLKYSLVESNFKEFKDVLNNKFTNQLVLDPSQIYKKQEKVQEDESLYVVLKIQQMGEQVIKKQWKKVYEHFVLLSDLEKLRLKCINKQKRAYFTAFLINKQLNFEQRKNQIKCEKYLENKQISFVLNTFSYLKQEFYIKSIERNIKAEQFNESRQNKLTQKIFRFLKIHWYDHKVLRQVELYYLSKIFSHFKKITQKQRLIARNKYISQYCFWLKKRMFNKLYQAVNNSKDERVKNDNAKWHYLIRLQRKVFDGWRQKVSKNDRYINLAMTMKNTFKETKDQRWIQIKTVDFKQIK